MDIAQWTSQGLDPARFSYLGVKAAVAHRGAYEPIAARLLWADTPGPCTSRLETLAYTHLRRPVYPLDPDTTV
jgi:microcystin degradation protein MlrC